MASREFPPIRFRGRLRPSQKDAVEVARAQLRRGKERLHVVAPPGSGKTVLGLYLWAEQIRRPALVLSPNSAIQSQWAARTDLFDLSAAGSDGVSTDPERPGFLTSLTYQAVTIPERRSASLDERARELWVETLIAHGEAEDPAEAAVWLRDLARHNADYYNDRLAAYRKEVREAGAREEGVLGQLHENVHRTIERLRGRDLGLIILDECHHLLGHWGRVLADVRELFDGMVVIGLTATPPDANDRDVESWELYHELLGPVDYEVPIPAVVKDGYLAPFQDLAYFVRPTAEELKYIAGTDEAFHQLVQRLETPDDHNTSADTEQPRETLPDWVTRVLTEFEIGSGTVEDWRKFERRDPALAVAGPLYLRSRGITLPEEAPHPVVKPGEMDEMEFLLPVLDRYVRRYLRPSPDEHNQQLAREVIAQLRLLGVQITERGAQPCASPVSRVLAYSRAKVRAMVEILKREHAILGNRMRAVVITDYEKTSATHAGIEHLLDEEAGGAIAAIRALVSDEATDALDPVLVTGSTVLADDDLAPALLAEMRAWLERQQIDVELETVPAGNLVELRGRGKDWAPRVYVGLITELFLKGTTRCMVGTRGLLGEGWDANKVNVLVDLTTVTTSMSINQLRGRSVRLDPDDPKKLADNWDVVCIAPEFAKGLDDYHRFRAKHRNLFGLTDDGNIEKGVGHVHAAFTELKPEGIEDSVAVLNSEMLDRAARRAQFYQLWRIGEPFHGKAVRAVELRSTEILGWGIPPHRRGRETWTEMSLTMAIGRAILAALQEAGLLRGRHRPTVTQRAGGYVRAFLEKASEEENALFAECLEEALSSFERTRYMIPRYVDYYTDTWLSKVLPSIVGRYFQTRHRERSRLHAVPAALARNKELALVYQKHWNAHVSPGEVLYGHGDEGEAALREARERGQVQGTRVHSKEIFV